MRRCSVLLAFLLAAAARASEGQLPARLHAHEPKLASARQEERLAAYEAFHAAGKQGRALLRARLPAIREPLAARCRQYAVPKDTQAAVLKAHDALIHAVVAYQDETTLGDPATPTAARRAALEALTDAKAAYFRSVADLKANGIPARLFDILLKPRAYRERVALALREPAGHRPTDPTTPEPSVEPETPPKPDPKLVASLKPHARKLTSANAKERSAAYEAYRIAGADGKALLVEKLLAIRKGLVARCRRLVLSETVQDKLLKLHNALEQARQLARDAIFKGNFDKAKVRTATDDLAKLHDLYKLVFLPVLRRLHPILQAYERLKEVDEQLGYAGYQGDVALNPPLADVVAGKIKAELVDALLKVYAFEKMVARSLRYNHLVKTSASSGERHVVDLTNEHRIRLGFQPLLINELLVRAARAHSTEMRALRYFSHSSPVPENRSFGQRARREGYTSGRGENIMSGGGAATAYWAWFYSAGHHRNMANPGSNEIGVGHDGPWTEVLGARKNIDLDHPPKSWPKPTPAPTPPNPKDPPKKPPPRKG